MTRQGLLPEDDRHATVKWVLNRFGPVLALVGVYVLFVVFGPESFRGVGTIELIVRQTAVVGIAALGMTIIMISGAIDLSVGSVVALSAVVVGLLLRDAGWPEWGAALAGIAAGMTTGLITGLIVTSCRVVPFIVTLGMMMALRGLALGLADETKVWAPTEWLHKLLRALPAGWKWLVLEPGVWLLVVLAVLAAVALRYTRFGRHVFAIGSNEQTARLCGVSIDRVKVLVFMLGGAMAGLAGVLQFTRSETADPKGGVGLELNVIAAVVIGGGSLAGGEGSILGTLAGALLMGVIATGCTRMGLDNWVQEIVAGVVIVIAVALDRLRHRRAAG